MRKIAICGVGLIGGSLAECFKQLPDTRVTGYVRTEEERERCLAHGVVDEATTSFNNAAADADFIFLCAPIDVIQSHLHRLSEMSLKEGCIITDVGSTKTSITKRAMELSYRGAHFIGGHPMAGSERSGVEAADEELFENAFYVLTPDKGVPRSDVKRLSELLSCTRAQIVEMAAELHDRIVGAISHLPHVIAVALVNQIADYNEETNLYRSLSAGGFRDITRIAASSPSVWKDILLSNREVLLDILQDWDKQLQLFIELLEQGDGHSIAEQFEKSRRFRNQIPDKKKGMIASLYDMYVDIPDHPGVIGEIATLLGKHHINLSNIQIMESRSEDPGVLRLSFRDRSAMDKAEKLLKLQYAIHY